MESLEEFLRRWTLQNVHPAPLEMNKTVRKSKLWQKKGRGYNEYLAFLYTTNLDCISELPWDGQICMFVRICSGLSACKKCRLAPPVHHQRCKISIFQRLKDSRNGSCHEQSISSVHNTYSFEIVKLKTSMSVLMYWDFKMLQRSGVASTYFIMEMFVKKK